MLGHEENAKVTEEDRVADARRSAPQAICLKSYSKQVKVQA